MSKFAISCGRPLVRVTDAKRQQQRNATQKKKVIIVETPQVETEPIEEDPPSPIPEVAKPERVKAPPKPTREELIEMYESLAERFIEALERREELKAEDRSLTCQIAAAYRDQAVLERQIKERLA